MKARKLRQGFGLFDTINILLLLFMTVLVVFPFYNCIVLSFNTGADAMKGHIYFWPRAFTVENYRKVLAQPIFATAAVNSVARTAATTLLAVIFTSAYAFVVSHRDLALRRFYLMLGLVTMYFSGGLIPSFLLIRDLGLMNSFLVYIFPGLFSMFNAILFMSFFSGLPGALEESARMDGANEWTVWLRIIMPVSKPVIAAVSLFVAVGQWNSWFDTMLYTKSEALETLSHMFRKMIDQAQYLEQQLSQMSGEAVKDFMQSQDVTTVTLQMSAMVITSFPIIALYPFLQKYFIQGVTMCSVKG
jgi:putative aldouronate transport system permease protein